MKKEATALTNPPEDDGDTMSAEDLGIIAENSDVVSTTAKNYSFIIEFRDCGTRRVVAPNVGAAWMAYKKHAGIIQTHNKPTIHSEGPTNKEPGVYKVA